MVIIACFLFVIVIFLSLIFYFKSYAVFREEKHFNVINGTIQDPGDIYFAYYVDDEITRSMPSYESGYTLDTTKSNCTNGVTVGWDNILWAAVVYYKNYKPENMTRTKCNLYFTNSLVDYIKNISKNDITNLATDDYENIRYIGSNPNNYVLVDGKLWRIIGVMKDIDDGTGNKETRVKLIRNEGIGSYSWDTSESRINGGYGVNEWSQADLMRLLNPGYENEIVGGSLYWDNKSGNCYNEKNNSVIACDFTSSGIGDNMKNLIGNALWNTGSNAMLYTYNNIVTNNFYTLERSSNNGKICSSGTYCNDSVQRTTTWIGKIGLMYQSDYGYATSGGITMDRSACLKTYLFSWNNFSDCKNNDWLFSDRNQWTMSPYASSSEAIHSFVILESGASTSTVAFFAYDIKPVVYLKSTVKIVSGIGTKENPFVIEI